MNEKEIEEQKKLNCAEFNPKCGYRIKVGNGTSCSVDCAHRIKP